MLAGGTVAGCIVVLLNCASAEARAQARARATGRARDAVVP
jgi:hypothetical protein